MARRVFLSTEMANRLRYYQWFALLSVVLACVAVRLMLVTEHYLLAALFFAVGVFFSLPLVAIWRTRHGRD